jgi:hypothetical protein
MTTETPIDIVFLPEHWKNICNNVRDISLNHFFPYIKDKSVRSKLISNLFETQSAEYFNSIGIPTKSCNNDKEPDIIFTETNESCEIKVTSSWKNKAWMGGEYSKRNSEYILIAWNYTESQNTLFGVSPELLEFSVINTYLTQDEWISCGTNFSGTKVTEKSLFGKKIKILV